MIPRNKIEYIAPFLRNIYFFIRSMFPNVYFNKPKPRMIKSILPMVINFDSLIFNEAPRTYPPCRAKSVAGGRSWYSVQRNKIYTLLKFNFYLLIKKSAANISSRCIYRPEKISSFCCFIIFAFHRSHHFDACRQSCRN